MRNAEDDGELVEFGFPYLKPEETVLQRILNFGKI
jgi:hypothetical protein